MSISWLGLVKEPRGAKIHVGMLHAIKNACDINKLNKIIATVNHD